MHAPASALFGALALAAVSAGAQIAPALPPPSVTTHATAHRRLPNTVADVSVGIETEDATITGVSKKLAERSGRLVAYLKAHNVTRLSTEQVSVETKTHTVKGGPDRIVGYSGSMTVSFRSSQERSSELIAGALDAGANTLGQVSFTPTEEEIDAAHQELAMEATRTAMAQAAAVAKAAGDHVVAVRDITVDPQNATEEPVQDTELQAPTPFPKMARAGVPRPIVTEAGDREISITVEVHVDIAP